MKNKIEEEFNWWLKYFDTWNLSEYDEDDLVKFISELEANEEIEKTKMMKMYLRLAKRD